MAIVSLARCKMNLILLGHLHVCYAGAGWASLLLQVDTATKTRRQGEVNAFNLIRTARPQVMVESLAWDENSGSFGTAGTARFQRTPEGWVHGPAETGADKA